MSVALASLEYQPVLNGNIEATATILAGHGIAPDGALAGSAGEYIFGVALSDVTAGNQAAYVKLGIAPAIAGAAIAAVGTELAVNAAGRFVAATSGNEVVGRSESTAAADGDAFSIFVYPGGIKA